MCWNTWFPAGGIALVGYRTIGVGGPTDRVACLAVDLEGYICFWKLSPLPDMPRSEMWLWQTLLPRRALAFHASPPMMDWNHEAKSTFRPVSCFYRVFCQSKHSETERTLTLLTRSLEGSEPKIGKGEEKCFVGGEGMDGGMSWQQSTKKQTVTSPARTERQNAWASLACFRPAFLRELERPY